jgi:hypothetical protein
MQSLICLPVPILASQLSFLLHECKDRFETSCYPGSKFDLKEKAIRIPAGPDFYSD